MTNRWEGNACCLYVAEVGLPVPGTLAAPSRFFDSSKSASLDVVKTIVHRGEVNRIRSCPHAPHIVLT